MAGEAVEMTKRPYNFNREVGYRLSEVWLHPLTYKLTTPIIFMEQPLNYTCANPCSGH
jgi:hypothetical protein